MGTSGAEATLRASLSGAPAYSDTTFNGATGPAEGAYQLNFQANSPGQILTVYFESADPTGYIFLKAATLEGPNVAAQAQRACELRNEIETQPRCCLTLLGWACFESLDSREQDNPVKSVRLPLNHLIDHADAAPVPKHRRPESGPEIDGQV